MAQTKDSIKIPDPGATGQVRLSEPELTIKIQDYILSIKEQTYKIPDKVADINTFFELVQKIVLSRQNQERTPESKRLLFLEDDPPEKLDSPAVTFIIQSRVPGRMDQGPAGTGGVKEVVPHYRGERPHPDHPGEKLVTFGRFYDNWIRFYINTQTKKEARKLLLWFEDVMSSYNWLFRHNGFRVIEEGAGDREERLIDGIEISRYPIVFMVRTEKVYEVSTQTLKEVILAPEIDSITF